MPSTAPPASLESLQHLLLSYPPLAAGFYVCSFVMEQLLQANIAIFRSQPFLFNAAATCILISGVCVKLAIHRPDFRSYFKRASPILGLYAYAYMTPLWSIDPDESLHWLLRFAPYVLINLLVAPFIITNVKELRKTLEWVFWIGFPTLLAIAATVDWGVRGVAVDDGGQELSPLAVAELAGALALIVLFLPILPVRIWLFVRWLIALLCVLIAVRTGSRGQVIGVAIVFSIVYTWIIQPTGGRIALTLLLISLAATVVAIAVKDAPSGYRWDPEHVEAGLQDRLNMIGALLDHWASSGPFHLLFGLGNSASYSSATPGIDIYPHFVPAEVLAEEGLIGFAMYLAFALLTFHTIAQMRFMYTHNQWPTAVLAAIVAVILYAVLKSMKSGSLLRTSELALYVGWLWQVEITLRWNVLRALRQPAESTVGHIGKVGSSR